MSLRERIREQAARRGMKQADLIELALAELEQADFLRSVASTNWDQDALAEAREWDDADIAGDLDSWNPAR